MRELSFYADNSLSPSLSWISAPDKHSDQLICAFLSDQSPRFCAPGFQPDIPIEYDYIAGISTKHLPGCRVFNYDPPACLRLLEPEYDKTSLYSWRKLYPGRRGIVGLWTGF